MKFFISVEADKDVARDIMNSLRDIEKRLNDKLGAIEYGEALLKIAIIPACVEPKTLEAGFFGERKLVKWKSKEADYRLHIDYHRYLTSDPQQRRLLVVKNVIDVVRLLGRKVRNGFDAVRLEDDILNVLGVTAEQIDTL